VTLIFDRSFFTQTQRQKQMSDTRWKISDNGRACRAFGGRADLSFTRFGEVAPVTRGRDEREEQSQFIAKFRSGRTWQALERLKTRLMRRDSELQAANDEAIEAASRLSVCLATGTDDEISKARRVAETKKRAAETVAGDAEDLRRQVVAAFDNCKAQFDSAFAEWRGERLAEARAAVHALIDEINAAMSPLLERFQAADHVFKAMMGLSEPPASALGPRPAAQQSKILEPAAA
jgi:hypothetical protein